MIHENEWRGSRKERRNKPVLVAERSARLQTAFSASCTKRVCRELQNERMGRHSCKVRGFFNRAEHVRDVRKVRT